MIFIVDRIYRVLYNKTMRITTQGDYALRCILHIADNCCDGPVSISRMVEDEYLPVDYIEQLLMKLRRHKLIKSVRGSRGGYLLNRAASAISVKDVIEAVEGDAFEVICRRRSRKKLKKCAASEACILKGLWVELKGRIEDFLGGETLESLLKKRG